MKQWICIALALVLTMGLTACGETQSVPSTSTTTEATEATVVTTVASVNAAASAPTEEIPFPREAGSYKERYVGGNGAESYLDYYLFVPENAVRNMPLVIFLHGDGEIGLIDDLESYGMIESVRNIYGEDFPFISISPCTRIPSWTDEDVSLLLKGLMDEVIATYSINPDQVIITGHSRGAIGTWDLISKYGDYFSAAVPVSCPNEEPLDWAECAEVPIWGFVGYQGEIEQKYAAFMEAAVHDVKEAGGSAELTYLWSDFHVNTVTNAYSKEVFDWMLSFGAPESPAAPETPAAPDGDTLGVEAGTYQESYHSSFYDRTMDYYMFVPENATENMPLIVYLHGDSEVGHPEEIPDIGMMKAAREIYGEAFPFLVLAPSTTQKTWTDFHIFNTTFDLIEEIAKQYKVDPERIILTGHSRGAIGTWYYLNINYYYQSFQTDIAFSCAVPVSHHSAHPLNMTMTSQIPIWAFVGDADAIETECKESLELDIDMIKAAGGNIQLTVCEGSTHGETEYTAYTKETFEWMLAQ